MVGVREAGNGGSPLRAHVCLIAVGVETEVWQTAGR